MFVSVNNINLFFDVEGAKWVPDGPKMREKPTVVLVHGGPGADHSIYKPFFSQLSDVAQIIFYDHRGNGRSDFCGPENWNLAQWADDLKGLCDALGIVKPIVLGTSFGGFVAQAYATRYRDHPGKLVLISTAAKMNFEIVYRAFGRKGGQAAARAAEEYWGNPTTASRARYRDICVPLYKHNKGGNPDWIARTIIIDDTALHFNGPENEHGKMDFRSKLAEVRCPTLVMGGESDPITPIEFSEEISACLPAKYCTFTRFPDAGHGIVGDCPDLALETIRNFVCDG